MNRWYYVQNGTQQGPVSEEAFLVLVGAGTIDAGTLIWRAGMADWQTYGSVADAPRDASVPPRIPSTAPQGPAADQPKIPNHMTLALILTVLCCFPPASIVAIFYAAKVNKMAAAGDIAGATEASRKAKLWCWITVGVGLLVNVAAILWMFPDLRTVYKSLTDLTHQLSAQDTGM